MQLKDIGAFIAKKIDDIIITHQAASTNVANTTVTVSQQNTGINLCKLLLSSVPTTAPMDDCPTTVNDWLTELGLQCYLDSFVEAGYDNIMVCEELMEEDLNHIGSISKPGHRKTLIVASKDLKERRKGNISTIRHFQQLPISASGNTRTRNTAHISQPVTITTTPSPQQNVPSTSPSKDDLSNSIIPKVTRTK